MQQATKFREYLRGVTPSDFYQPWAQLGSWPVRNYEADEDRACWLCAMAAGVSRAALCWSTPDADAAGRPNQEWLIETTLWDSTEVHVAHLRVSGAAGAENAYSVSLNVGAGIVKIYLIQNGARSQIATASGLALRVGGRTWLRFRASGTTITARAWPESAAEPAPWSTTATDATLADGAMALGAEGSTEINFWFVGVGTAGDSAPAKSSIPGGLFTWLLDSGKEVEFTAEWQGFDPLAQLPQTVFFSSKGRYTGPFDYPPNAEMLPLLAQPAAMQVALTDDDLMGGLAQQSLGSSTLNNLRGLLNYLSTLTFDGRRMVIRAGLRSWRYHRWFEPIVAGTFAGEPTSGSGSVGSPPTVDAQLADPLFFLKDNLLVNRYVGIQTGVLFSSCTAAAPYIAAYDCKSFTLPGRLCLGAPPAANTYLAIKGTTGGTRNFSVYVEAGTGYLVGEATFAGTVLQVRSLAPVTNGAWRRWALAVDDLLLMYLLVDGQPQQQLVPPASVDLPATAISVAVNGVGIKMCDLRLYNYCMAQEDVQAAMQTRPDGTDSGLVGFWPMDDLLGSSATDYSPSANSIALGGTIGVQYSFVPTDLGQDAIKGNLMQVALGAAQNALAVRIDDNRQRFLANDGALPGGGTYHFRAKGFPLIPVTDYADAGNGVVQMTGVQSEPVTFDVGPSGSVMDFSLLPNVVRDQLLVKRGGLGEPSYDPLSFEGLGALLPYQVQYVTATETKVGEALKDILDGCGAHARLDSSGRIYVASALPTITPGPYPGQAALEMLGFARGRVNFGSSLGDQTNLFGSPHSFVFWVKTFATAVNRTPAGVTYGADQPLIAKTDGSSGYYISITSVNEGQLYWNEPGLLDGSGHSYLMSPQGMLKWGTWTFVGLVYDGAGTRTIYAAPKGRLLQQVAQGAVASGTTHLAASSELELGGSLFGGIVPGSLVGSMQHVQLWGKALSPSELQGLMSANPAGTETNLRFYAPLTDGHGDRATDVVSGGTGKIMGARWAPRLVFDFTAGLESSRFAVKPTQPAWEGLNHYRLNNKPLADSDIAAAVNATQAAALKRPQQTASDPAAAVKGTYLGARVVELSSGCVDAAQARAVARAVRYRFAPQRIFGELTDAPRAALSLLLGDEVWVIHPGIPGGAGAAFRVVGANPTYSTLVTTLNLWGDRLDPAAGAILADDGRPLLADDAGDAILS